MTLALENVTDKAQALVQNSVLLRLQFGILGNSKRANLAVDTTASQKRFQVHKKLLESPELKAISQEDFKIRQWIDKQSVPFDMGVKLVSMKKVPTLVTGLKEYQSVTRPQLVASFKAAFPAQLEQAQQELGPEFNLEEFPSVDSLDAQFSFDYKIVGFNVPEELKSISSEIFAAEVEKAQAQISTITHEIEQAQRSLLLTMIDTLDDKLGEGKVPTQGAITKLQKFLAEFELQDVTSDKKLASLVSDLKGLTEGISAKGIKDNAGFQSTLAQKVLSVQSSLEEMVENRPARRIKKDEDE